MMFAGGIVIGFLLAFVLFLMPSGKRKQFTEVKPVDVEINEKNLTDESDRSVDEQLSVLVNNWKEEHVGKLKELYDMKKGNEMNSQIAEKIDNIDYDEAIFN